MGPDVVLCAGPGAQLAAVLQDQGTKLSFNGWPAGANIHDSMKRRNSSMSGRTCVMYEILIEEDCIAGFVNRTDDLLMSATPASFSLLKPKETIRFDDRVHSLREELKPRRILRTRKASATH